MRLVVFVGMAVLLFSLCLLFAGPELKQRIEKQYSYEEETDFLLDGLFEFVEPYSSLKSETGLYIHGDYIFYIWTPKKVYLVGEPVPIYVETVAKKTVWAREWEEGDDGFSPITVHHPLLERYAAELRVYHSEYGFVGVHFFGDYSWVSEPEENFIPDISEIPINQLHGRLVMPIQPEKGCWWRLPYFEKGDCYVTRINNLLRFLRARLRVLPPGKKLGYQPFLDDPPATVGVYRVQYFDSNIIEFEIR